MEKEKLPRKNEFKESTRNLELARSKCYETARETTERIGKQLDRMERARELLELGHVAIRAGRYNEAILYFSNSLDSFPTALCCEARAEAKDKIEDKKGAHEDWAMAEMLRYEERVQNRKGFLRPSENFGRLLPGTE